MGESLSKEWKFTGSVYCTGSGCDKFPDCSGAINKAMRELGCEIELHGEVIEVKDDHPVKREIPCL